MNLDNNSAEIEVELGSDLLALIGSLYARRDRQSLGLLHIILSKFIMSSVRDAKTSFVDISEYCEALMLALGGSSEALKEAKSLEALIKHDLKSSEGDSQ